MDGSLHKAMLLVIDLLVIYYFSPVVVCVCVCMLSICMSVCVCVYKCVCMCGCMHSCWCVVSVHVCMHMSACVCACVQHNRLYLSNSVVFSQGDIGLNAAKMVMQLVKDNRKIVDRITHKHIDDFVDLLRQNKVIQAVVLIVAQWLNGQNICLSTKRTCV